ncbi:hypothetical protein LEP1GSC170_5825 [Leptospira interrogans serovar Bataviae str. HAI135]|nr:hypothetical protein LEP1GSC170_5825 [Leptospira interrogans serovar Bataviae str. HAI135]
MLKISISTIHKKVLSICFNEKRKLIFQKLYKLFQKYFRITAICILGKYKVFLKWLLMRKIYTKIVEKFHSSD